MQTKNNCFVKVQGVSKSFAGNTVLQPFNLEIRPGEFHALIGENGAGKSTLINLLTGVYEPDGGVMTVDGQDFTKLSPAQSQKLDIQAVHQELSLNRHLTVAENIFLGTELLRGGVFRRKKEMEKKAGELLADIGLGHICPTDYVSALSLPEQQLLEFSKAASKKPKLLILDEATSALNSEQVETLFGRLREMKKDGLSILFISHRLNELFDLCDIMTVLKDGQQIVTEPMVDFNQDRLVKLMTGRELTDLFPPKPQEEKGEPVIRLEKVCTRHLQDISFTVQKGEILGIGGLAGQGQQQVLECLFGIEKIQSGTMELNGKPLKLANPKAAMRQGIAYLPGERKTEGLFLTHTIKYNMSFSRLDELSNFLGTVSTKREKEDNEGKQKELAIKLRSMAQHVGELSGGNQQKVVLGKWLLRNPEILLMNEPTRGIDVGTKQQIYSLLRQLADKGVTVLLLSSDTLELIGMCDRVLVLYENRINSEILGENLSEETLVHASVFQKEENA